MALQGNGDLAPRLEAARCADNCRLCVALCPFAEGLHNPRRRNTEIYRGQPQAKLVEDIGWHTDCLVGFRRDPILRRASSSGGLVTWCLETLLEEGFATRAAVIRIAKNRDRGFFEFYAASSVGELRQSAGSVYHPVEISGIVEKMVSNPDERWAVVGVPCLCAALRNSPRLTNTVAFVLGLACGMYQNTFHTEMLLSKSGVDRERVVKIEYRRKSDDGSPSDYRFRGTDDRRPGKEVRHQGLPYYLGRSAFFRLDACNFCMDVFAETADACFMDAWLPEYLRDPRGTSLVVIRNRELTRLFQRGLGRGAIWFAEIGPEQVIASQQGQIRRKRELIDMRRGIRAPAGTGRGKVTTLEKIAWLIQRRTQKRSKKIWVTYGRKYGRWAFWLAATDLLLLQSLAGALFRMIRLPNRWIGKRRNRPSPSKS
jgi:coenzyme F420-reducing hydrogenase beta subunit